MPGVELLLAAAILPFDDKFTGNGIGDVQDGTSMVVGRRGHRNGELENSNLRLASEKRCVRGTRPRGCGLLQSLNVNRMTIHFAVSSGKRSKM